MSAGEFKQTCLALMDKVASQHIEYIVTKRGVPVVRVVPAEKYEQPSPIFGSLANHVTYIEDLTKPTREKWDAEE
ncbi:MAG: type II toxin-antitoxin system prevent-host-death family antitoxin [Oligoflexia bacterium]|nr:type II toxin-antitoxin system prevent-host-death family antitoxin [Oligoflexia bacterium]